MKKRAFAIIEAIIAITLATFACFFLLQFESTLLTRSRQSVKDLEYEQAKQQAIVSLFEHLYTNQISWKTILEGKSYSLALPHSSWTANYEFKPLYFPEMVEPTIIESDAVLTLVNNAEPEKRQAAGPAATIRVCVKKESASDAKTA